MTQRERKAMQRFFNRMTDIDRQRDEAFKDLQGLSRKHNMTVWCSALHNLEQLKGTEDGNKAQWLYDNYVKFSGQWDLITDFGSELAELNFWKH